MKLLNLGAGGFIGSHLTRRLLQSGYTVVAVDIHTDKIEDCLQHDRLTYLNYDISASATKLERLIADADLVIDLIAHANPGIYVRSPLDVFRLNFTENLRIAEACVKYSKRLIQFSSCEVYGRTAGSVFPDIVKDPDDPALATFSEETTSFILGPVNKHRWIYSCAKQLLERVLHAYGLEGKLNYTIIRPFNFIGPQIDYFPSETDGVPRVFSYFIEAILRSKPMQLVEGGKNRRCYTYIDDAIDCIMKIVDNSNGVCDRQIFNIGSPANETSIKDLAYLMRDLAAEVFHMPQESLPEVLEVTAEEFYGSGYDDSDRRIPDISKAQSLLKWQPVHTLRETVEKSMRYYLDNSER